MAVKVAVTRGRRRLRRIAAVVGAGAVAAAVLASSAQAHTFLVRSDPPAGARLATPPGRLVMHFSEPFVRGSEHVSVRPAKGGPPLALPAPSGGKATITQGLPSRLNGAYVVSWQVISDDGHLCAGEYAFAVGSGAIPAVSASDTPTPWSQAAASWLFFAGLAVALGGLLSELLVWRRARVRAPVEIGIVVSTLASAWLFVLLAGARRGGGFSAGLHGGALRATLSSRPGTLTVAVIGVLALAALLVRARPLRALALAPLAAAAVLTSARGHAGTSGHWWAPVIDSIHLLGAAAWVGALTHLCLVVARDRAAADRSLIGRYARLALPTVLVILASGILTAFAEFRNVGSAFHTSYGRTLVVKAGLVLGALALAAGSRFLALRANPGVRLRLLRRLTLGETGLLVAVLAVVGLLINLAPPRTAAASAAGGDVGPPPLTGPAVRLAGFAGDVAVGLAAGDGQLQFQVLPPPGGERRKYRLTVSARGPRGKSAILYPRPCGTGCFSIRFSLQPGRTRLTATVSTPGAPDTDVVFEVAAPLPAGGAARLRQVLRAMRALPAVDVTERLSDGTRPLTGPRTYRLTGRGFVASEAFVDAGTVDERVLGHSGGLAELTFASRDSKTWYSVWVDGADRVRREEVVAAGLRATRSFAYPSSADGAVPFSAPLATGTIPRGPFVAAREDDDLAVAFAARPAGDGRLRLTTTVIGQDGDGATSLDVTTTLRSAVDSRGADLRCGPGCYSVTLPFAGRPRQGLVTIRRLGHRPSVVRFDFPSRWPPPDAERLAREATRVFDGLRTVTIDEHLGSNPTNVRHTLWRLEAPDRVAYDIRNGPKAVLIGNRRWDRDPGGPWVESAQLPVRQPTATWGGAPSQAALLGSGVAKGRAVWWISFVDPDVPAWFTVAVDKQTMRTLELRMTAAAHFMRHVYGGFDARPTIRPPVQGARR